MDKLPRGREERLGVGVVEVVLRRVGRDFMAIQRVLRLGLVLASVLS
jgi:hypothetical protein